MASIVERKAKNHSSYNISFYQNGKQNWEYNYRSLEDAMRRKAEIESGVYRLAFSSNVGEETLIEFIRGDFERRHIEMRWSDSFYATNRGIIKNYIAPLLGCKRLKDIDADMMWDYFAALAKMMPVRQKGRKQPSNEDKVSRKVQKEAFVILQTVFKKAVEWNRIPSSPIVAGMKPTYKKKKVKCWDYYNTMQALALCEDRNVKLAIALALAGTLRIGEVLGMQWEQVTFSPDKTRAEIMIDRQLQRIDKEAVEKLQSLEKAILYVFPDLKKGCSSSLMLKTPKTEASVRKFYAGKYITSLLLEQKAYQDQRKKHNPSYTDYGMVLALKTGRPVAHRVFTDAFKKLISTHELPDVCFHSLRHTSATYKLMYSRGDLKFVQSEGGWILASTVTEIYAEILDENRKITSVEFQDSYFDPKQNDLPAHIAEQEIGVGELLLMLQKAIETTPDVIGIIESMIISAKSTV